MSWTLNFTSTGMPLARSYTKRIVTRMHPTSTTNMTGFFAMVRGFSFLKLSPMAGRMIAGSQSEVVLRTWCLDMV